MTKMAKCHPNRKHYAKNLCKSCYHLWQYRNNPHYREIFKARVRKSMEKKARIDPEWNARRQRKWRAENPEKFNYLMAKYYFRRLTPEYREKLIKEIEVMG